MAPDVLTVYRTDDGQWRWRVEAANHETIGAATESYERLSDCMANIIRTVNLSGDMDVVFADEPKP